MKKLFIFFFFTKYFTINFNNLKSSNVVNKYDFTRIKEENITEESKKFKEELEKKRLNKHEKNLSIELTFLFVSFLYWLFSKFIDF